MLGVMERATETNQQTRGMGGGVCLCVCVCVCVDMCYRDTGLEHCMYTCIMGTLSVMQTRFLVNVMFLFELCCEFMKLSELIFVSC